MAIFRTYWGVGWFVPTLVFSILPDLVHLPYSFSIFLYLLHSPPCTLCFYSCSCHNLSIISQLLLTTSVTSSVLFSPSDTLSLREKLHVHRSSLVTVCSNCLICSAFNLQVSHLYPTALITHVAYTFLSHIFYTNAYPIILCEPFTP